MRAGQLQPPGSAMHSHIGGGIYARQPPEQPAVFIEPKNIGSRYFHEWKVRHLQVCYFTF
jgi:hypothetical protein